VVVIVGGIFWDQIFYGKPPHYEELIECPGGSALNVSVALKLLGHEVGLIGNVGNDVRGDEILRFLKEIGVSFLGERKGKTGVFVSSNEKEVLGVYRGANLSQFSTDPPEAELYFLTMEMGLKNFERIKEKLKGRKLIVDAFPLKRFEFEQDVFVIANEGFQGRANILKLGEKGAIWGSIFESVRKKGNFPLATGDAFDAVIIDGILKGMDEKSILKKAVEIAEMVSSIKGTSVAIQKVFGGIEL